MSAIRIYGTPGSRAMRTLWMAEELRQEVGLSYELVPTHFMKDAKQPAFLAINPNGRVPAMEDDGFVLFESLAINLYLAKANPGSVLAPQDLREDALATQWSMWALTELEDNFIALVARHPNIAMLPPDEKIEAEAQAKLARPLKVLEQHLSSQAWLAAERFNVADLNVAGVIAISAFIQYDLSPYPAVKTWFEAATARPAFTAVRAM